MNILILYTTNSGGTEMAANEIAQRLSNGYTVDTKRILDVKPEEISAHDVIVIGTPSWDFEGREGQPHEDWFVFKKSLHSNPFEGKKMAVFGLGDSSYKIFTGGVTELENWVNEWKGQKIVDSLRIDKFFYQQAQAMEAIEKWCNQLLEALK